MKAVRRGFIKSIPILCSYLFVGMAYGITMQNDGFFCMMLQLSVYLCTQVRFNLS